MSKKSIAKYYVPVYRDLMDVKEYVKLFQTKSIGSMYIIIVSKVWRRGYSWTDSEGYYGWIKQLSKEYDDGNLCAYLDDKDLADQLGVHQRHVRRMRNQLIELGLIEAEKESYRSTGVYYRVGKVLSPGEFGRHNEALYIERWVNEVEDQKEEYGKISPAELDFVQRLQEVLATNATPKKTSKGKKKKKISPETDIQSRVSGHTEPDQSKFEQRENASGTEKIEVSEEPKNNKNIKRTINSSNEVPVQGRMFETIVDLSYIDVGLKPQELGRALVRESNRVDRRELKDYLAGLLKKHNLHVDPMMQRNLFFSTFVDVWFKKFPPASKSMSTPIIVWWKALSIDLERPDLIKDAKKNMIVASKIEGINNWYEFSFLVKELFTNNGGMEFYRNFKHITWLQNSLKQEVYKLTGFRKNVNISALRNAKPLDVDELNRKVIADLEEDARRAGVLDDEDDEEFDIDDLLD